MSGHFLSMNGFLATLSRKTVKILPMARRSLLAFFIMLLSSGLSGQSLSSVEALLDTATQLLKTSYEESDRFARQALSLSQKNQNPYQEAAALSFLAEVHYRSRNFEQSDEYASQGIQKALPLNDQKSLFSCYLFKAYALLDRNQINEGLKWLPLAQEAALKSGAPPKKMVLILSGLGYWNGQIGNFELAYEKLHEALDLTKPDSLANLRSYVLTLLSATSMSKGDYNKALLYETRSLMSADSLGDTYRVDVSRHNLCDIYLQMGDYAKALEEAKEIERKSQFVKDERIDGGFHDRMGIIYFQMKEYDLSRNYFEQALEFYQTANDEGGAAMTISNMTPLLIEQGDLQLATDRLSRLLTRLHESKDTMLSLRCQLALANVWNAQGKYPEAQKAYLDCIPFYEKQQIWNQLAETYFYLAKSFRQSGDLPQSLHYAENAQQYFEKAHMNIRKAEVLKLQYELHKALGQLDLALASHEAYFEYTDSIRTEVAQRRLMEERVNKNVDDLEKEKEVIALRNSVLANQNRLFQLTALFLVLGLAGFSWFYWRLRKARNRLKEQKDQLESLNQTKDRFFGIIAHDLRSPIIALQGVGMQMDYFLEKNNPNQLKRVATSVDETAKRLNGLLDNLLAWALSQTGRFPYRPEPYLATVLVDRVIDVFKTVADLKKVAIQASLPPALAIYADENAVQTILRNLIGNALKFTEQGGTILISATQEGAWATFAVKDSGIGMSSEQLEQLFDLRSYSKTGTSGEKGTGLGLLLCKELVELHGGQIHVRSAVGQGTTIFFTLPLVASPTNQPNPKQTQLQVQ